MRYPTQLVKRPSTFDPSDWQAHQTPPFCTWGDHAADVPAVVHLQVPGEAKERQALCMECAKYLAESLLMNMSCVWKGIEIGQPETTGDNGHVLAQSKSGDEPMRLIWLRRPRRLTLLPRKGRASK